MNHRRLGHGIKLMTAAGSEAKTSGFTQIVLQTHSFNFRLLQQTWIQSRLHRSKLPKSTPIPHVREAALN
jgi:hypothetical protein